MSTSCVSRGRVVSGHSGGQLVLSGGIAIGTFIQGYSKRVYGIQSWCNEIQSVEPGGIASGTTAGGIGIGIRGALSNAYGVQHVRGTACETVLVSCGTQMVSSGGTAVGTKVSSGGEQFVYNGGITSSTMILVRGIQFVDLGRAYCTTVKAGGTQRIVSGGRASDTKVSSGGKQEVEKNGSAIGTTVCSGGAQFIYSNGSSLSATVKAKGSVHVRRMGVFSSGKILGRIIVSDGGAAKDVFVSSGGTQTVLCCGAALDCSIGAYGVQHVSKGVARGTVVQAHGVQILSGGNAFGTILNDGGVQHIRSLSWRTSDNRLVVSNGTAVDTTVESGGVQHVSSGGHASETELHSEGVQLVLSGGYASATRVFRGGIQRIRAGGSATTIAISAGGRQYVSLGGATSTASVAGAQHVWGVVLDTKVDSGGVLNVNALGLAKEVKVSSGGRINVKSGGTASAVGILAEGTASVSSGALLRTAEVHSNGRLNLAGNASCLTLRNGASFSAVNVLLYGTNLVEGVKKCEGELSLAKGATIVISGRASAGGLSLSASSGAVSFAGAGIRLARFSVTKDTALSFDISKQIAGCVTLVEIAEKNSQKVKDGRNSIIIAKQQTMGSYGITQNFIQARDTVWTVKQGNAVLGTACLNGSGFSKDGVTYRLTAAKDKISLTLSAKAGKMLKGTTAGETVKGTKDSDVFWGDNGNDDFRNGAGRDCAVYGTENWGKDTITKTAGTLALVFKDLTASDVTSSLSGTTMTVKKKADPRQTVTVAGWDANRHSLVFGGAMSAFDAWAKATSPTAAQAKAARAEVWKKAGLAVA